MNTKPDITLTSPTDLVAVVPYLLGFHPSDSLVMVGLSGGTIALSARVDLPPPGESVDTVPLTPATLRRNHVHSVALVGYGDPHWVTLCLDHLRTVLAEDGIDVIDVLRVTDGRWWSYLCTDTDCCPVDGTPIDEAAAVVAGCVSAGASALPSREAMAAQLDPADATIRAAVAKSVQALVAITGFDRRRARGERLELLRTVTASTELPGIADTARLGVGLTDPRIRDEAIAIIDDGTHRLDLWIWLVRHLPDGHVAPAATVAGYAAYRSGNGALAHEAIDKALADQPDYELARLLRTAVNSGMPPQALPPLTRAEIAASYGETAPPATETADSH